MALEKQDFERIGDLIDQRLDKQTARLTSELCGFIQENVVSQFDDIHVELQTMNNKLAAVEGYKVTQLQLIKLLREKKVITSEEAHILLKA